jgi:hypothetical protein
MIKEKDIKQFFIKTNKHIGNIKKILDYIKEQINDRGNNHDKSKFNKNEIDGWILGSNLEQLDKNSDEYNQAKKLYDNAYKIHHKQNRHHPEYFKHGFSDMNVVDVVEIIADWMMDAVEENKSFEQIVNEKQKEFNFDNAIRNLLINSAKEFNGVLGSLDK